MANEYKGVKVLAARRKLAKKVQGAHRHIVLAHHALLECMDIIGAAPKATDEELRRYVSDGVATLGGLMRQAWDLDFSDVEGGGL